MPWHEHLHVLMSQVEQQIMGLNALTSAPVCYHWHSVCPLKRPGSGLKSAVSGALLTVQQDWKQPCALHPATRELQVSSIPAC